MHSNAAIIARIERIMEPRNGLCPVGRTVVHYGQLLPLATPSLRHYGSVGSSETFTDFAVLGDTQLSPATDAGD